MPPFLRHPYTDRLHALAAVRGRLIAALAVGDAGAVAAAARALLDATSEPMLLALADAHRQQLADTLGGAATSASNPDALLDPGAALALCLAGAWTGDQEREREARPTPRPRRPGLALTLTTAKQRRIVAALEAHPGKLQKDIAAIAGASVSMVSEVRRRWAATIRRHQDATP
jgi:hypothetical protein